MNQSVLWTGYRTIVRKEITRILRIWGQTLVPPAITMTLYFIIFGNLIGRRIGEMGGFDYMQFIVPGLVMMSVISNSYGNMVSSFFGAKYGRHIEELLISPQPNWIILAGYVTGAMFRGVVVGAVDHLWARASAARLFQAVAGAGRSRPGGWICELEPRAPRGTAVDGCGGCPKGEARAGRANALARGGHGALLHAQWR